MLGPTTYRLDLPVAWKIHNAFHGSLLEPYIETAEHGPNYAEPPPELVEGEPEYKVEAILDSRRQGQGWKLEYLVRWKGWGPAHDSWEPKENLHADDLLKEYFEKNPTAIRRARLEGRQGITPLPQQCQSSLLPSSATIRSLHTSSTNFDQGSEHTLPTPTPSNTHTSAKRCIAATIVSTSTTEALDRKPVGRR